MKLVSCFIFILFRFFFSCNDAIDISSKINYQPTKPLKLLQTAKWYGGPDGGNWFNVSKLNDKKYRIENYFDDGSKQWDGIFIIDKLGFDLKNSYDIIHESNYTKCTIRQKSKKYVLTFEKDI